MGGAPIRPPGLTTGLTQRKKYGSDTLRFTVSDHSKIEWTDTTWNPLRGCTKISPGCKHCYAETFAERFRGVPGHPYEQGFDLRLVPDKLSEPFLWSGPRTVFVNSMTDLFHADVPDDYVEDVARVMVEANWHTYQVLTKRADRLAAMLSGRLRFAAEQRHIWWGVSVEDRKHGLPRIEHLRSAPAAIRFLSIEPLLEDLGEFDLCGIDWAIVGGESGHGARPMEAAWVESILNQTRKYGTHFFFKQWGGIRKSKTGRELRGTTFDEMPERIVAPFPPRKLRLPSAQAWDRKAARWNSSRLVLLPALA
jgi:protein gp37